MDYTQSNSYDDAGGGKRYHEDAKSVPTVWSAKDANSIMWSMMAVLEAVGLPGAQFNRADPATYRLLLRALRTNGLIYGADTGAVNAAVVNLTPAIPELVDGMLLWFKAAATNTGPTTLNVNGLGALPIRGLAHNALQGSEIVVGGRCQVIYHAALNVWVLLECSGAALQIAPATQSQHAMQLGQATGRLLNIQVITASATYTPTAGARVGYGEGCGAGGGGGGSANPGTSGQASCGGGGSAGAYGRFQFTITGPVAATIGTGGNGSVNANGGNGGTTSLGSIATFPGGKGGSVGIAGVGPYSTNHGATSGNPTGTNIYGLPGWLGHPGFNFGSGAGLSGRGADSPYGAGGGGIGSSGASGANGFAASGFGAGGSGSITTGNNGASNAGGAGTGGLIIIYEHA